MSVVLRCPNCGTPQEHGGDCEACSEGEVQYFCTNHDPRVWLEGPVCSRCGATFRELPRSPVPAPTPPRVRSGPPDFRPPVRRRVPERPPEPGFERWPPRRPDPDVVADPEALPRTPSLGELLEEMTEARGGRRAPHDVDETPWAPAPARGIGLPLAGCLLRLLAVGVLLFLAFVVFLFLVFGGLIRG